MNVEYCVLVRASRISLSVALYVALVGSGWAQSVPASTAVPQGGQVSAGSATIQQGGTATNPVVTVTQSSQRAAINWQSFNLGRDASVQFQQPSAASVTLNRVVGSDPSSIFGKISSNGQIYLINPNGIYFSPTASVDVGGLVATTHGMRDDDFMAGSTTFTRDGATGKVVNEGVLRARMGGYIALLAPEVRNAGIIVAKSGTVALAAGDAVTLNVDANNSLTNLLVKPSTMQALVDNQKIVNAPDGQVIVSAQAYNEIAAGVINNSGEISAKGISKSGGAIVLGASTAVNQTGKLTVSSKAGNGGTVKIDAKTVTQSGSIKADSIATNGKGGAVTLTGDALTLKTGSAISADGAAGGGTVLIGGDWQGSNGVRQAQTVVMEQGASITANATQAGDGGKVVLWSDVTDTNSFTRFDGVIEAKGFAGGAGGRVETSGHVVGVSNGRIDATSGGGENGLWLLDPYDISISGGGTTFTGDFTASATSSICACSINTMLNSGTNVTISTGAAGSPGADTGFISMGGVISKTAGPSATLTLSAAGSLAINRDITSTSNALNLVLDSGGGSTASGILALGTGTLTKLGVGKITVTGANTYTGTTTINGGTLVLTTSPTGLGPANGGAIIINSGGTLDVQTNIGTKAIQLGTGGILTTSTGTGIIGGPVTLTGNGTINASAAMTISGVISGAGFGFTKAGINTLTLIGDNTFSGGLTVSAGTLTANKAAAFDINSGNLLSSALGVGANVVISGGTLTVNQPATINSLSATSGSLSLAAALTFGGDNSSTSFVGTISGSQLIKNGTGIFINGNSGTSNSNYVINNGIMKLNNGNAGTYAAITIGANGTLDLNGFNAGASSFITHLQGSGFNTQGAIINSSATTSSFNAGNVYWDSMSDFLINTANGQITFYSALEKSSSTPTIVKTGAGALNAVSLSGSSANVPSAYNILQGTATVGSGFTSGSHLLNISVASGASVAISLAGTQTYSGVISGAGNVSYVNGTTTVSGNNTYTGTTTISGASVLPGYATHYTNGVIDYSPFGASPTVIMGNVANSSLSINTYATELLSLSGGGTTGGNVSIGLTTLTVGAGNNNTTYAGVLSAGSYTGSLVKIGTGTLTLSGTNTFSGPTTINAGTLVAASAGAMGTVSATASQSVITVNSGATFDLQVAMTSTKPMALNGGTFQNSGASALTYTGAISLTADSIVNTSGNNLTLSGVISNTGGNFGFTKNGSNVLTISGASNTYAGPIVLNSGKLVASSVKSLGASSGITINSGTTLDVQATQTAAVPVTLNGGTLSNTANTVSYSGAMTLTANSTVSVSTTASLTLSSAISDAGGGYSLTATGAGTAILIMSGGLSATSLTSTVPTTTLGGTVNLASLTHTGSVLNISTGANVTVTGTLTETGTGTSTWSGSVSANRYNFSAQSLTMASTANVTTASNTTLNFTFGYTLGGTINTGANTFSMIGNGSSTVNALTVTGTGLVTLQATAVTLGGAVTASNPLLIKTTAGDFTSASNALTSTGGDITITTQGTGTAGRYFGSGNITSAGTLTITSATLFNSTGTGILSGTNGVSLNSLAATSALTLTGAVNSSAGGITISSLYGISNNANMTAYGNIAISNAGNYVSSGASATTIKSTTGNISISSTGTSSIGSFTSVLDAAGTVTVTQAVNLTYSGTIKAGGDVTITSTSGDVGFSGSLQKIYGANDATLWINGYAGANISGNIYANNATTDNSSNGKLNIFVNPDRAAANGALGSASLTGTIRTQGGYFYVLGGTSRADYVNGTNSAPYGNPGVYVGGSAGFKLYTNGGDVRIFAKSGTLPAANTNGAIYLQGNTTINTASGNLYIEGLAQAGAFAGLYNYCNGCGGGEIYAATSGNISFIGTAINGGLSAFSLSYSNTYGAATISTTTGNITMAGKNYVGGNNVVSAVVTILPQQFTITSTSGNVLIQGQVPNGWSSYTNAYTGTAISSYATITTGGSVVMQSDGFLTLSYNSTGNLGKITSPAITLVTRTIASLPSNIFSIGSGRVWVYLSDVVSANNVYYATGSVPAGTGTTFTRYGSACSWSQTQVCLENANAPIPTTNGTLLVSYSNIASPLFSFSSNQIAPTLGALANASSVYGNAAFIETLTSNSTANITYTSSNTAIATVNATTGAVTPTGVGSVTITATQAGNIFYQGATANYTVAVAARPITISGTRAYDGTTNVASSILQVTNKVGADTVTLTGSLTGALSGTGAGTYALASLSGLTVSNANYTITGGTGSVTITKANATVTANSDQLIYNGTLRTASGFSAAGLVNGETASVLAGVSVAGGGTNAGSYTITASGTDPNYNLSFVNGTMTIAKASLTVTAVDDNKIYNAAAYNGGNGVSYSGFVNNETASVLSGALAYNGTAQGAINAGSYTILPAGLSASNYSFNYIAGSLTVAKAPLTIQAQTDNKTYDGTTSSTPVPVVSGLKGSDSVTLLAQQFASKDVALVGTIPINVASGYSINDNNGGNNYTITALSSTGAISPKALSVTGTTVTDRVYDGTTNVAATLGVLTGFVGTETLSITPAGVAVAADAGSRATTVAYGLANGTNGGLASNYSLASTNHTVTITLADLVLTGTRAYDKTSVVAGSILTATGVGGDSFSVTGAGDTSNLNSVNAGTYPLASLTGLSLGANKGQGNPANYQLSTTGSSIIVTKIPITLTGDRTGTVQKTYDGNTSLPVTGTAPYTVTGGLLNGDSVSFTGAAAFDSANAGARNITQGTLVVTGPSAGNYSLSWTDGTGTIAQAPLTVTANNAAGFMGQTPAFSVSYSGFVNGETAATANVSTTVALGAGNALIPSMAPNQNYSAVPVNGLYTVVAPSKILVTVDNGTKIYGSALPALTASNVSYFGTDPNTHLPIIMNVSPTLNNTTANTYDFPDGTGGTKSFTITSDATQRSPVSTYAITILSSNTTLSDPSKLQVQNGVMTVTPRPISVQASGVSKTYDGNTSIDVSANGFTVAPTGLLSGDVVTASAIAGLYADKNAGNSKSYTLSGISLAGADAANYYLSAGANYTGSNGAIAQKSVSVSGITAANKIYDGNTTATVAVNGAIIGGLVAGDNVSVGATGAFDSQNAATGKTVTLASTYSGADAANYSFVSQATTTATITPKALTMTGTTVADKIYDGTLTATATQGVLTGFVSGEQVTSTIASANFDNKNAGNRTARVIYQLANGNNGLASNYSLDDSYIGAVINQREVSLSAARVYNAATDLSPGVVTITTGVAGEALSYAAGATSASKNVGAGNYVSSLTLQDGIGGLASNYVVPDMTVAGAKNTVTFTAAPLTITGMAATAKTYDGTTAATLQSGSLSGVLSTDQVTLTQTGQFNSKNVGAAVAVTSTSTITGTDAQNYSLTQPTTLTAAITPKDITVSGLTIAASKVYDGTTNATITAGGSVTTQNTGTGTTNDGNLYSVDAVVLSGTPQAFYNSKDVASANLATVSGYSLTGTGAGNYTLTAPTQAASITPKNVTIAGLTITASKIYDGTTAAAMTGTATLLSQSAGAGNSADGKIYTVDPLVAIAGTAAAAYDSKDVLSASTISISGLSLSGAGSGNYTLVPLSQSGTITPKNLTMTGLTLASPSKTYDGTTTAILQNATGTLQASSAAGTGTSADGVPYTGDVVALSGTAAANYTTKNVGTGLTIVFSGVGLSGSEASNYTLTQQTALSNGAITPKSLSVANTTVANKIYDTTTMASLSNGSLVGLVAGDASGVVLNQAGAFVDANAGVGKAVVASDSISGASAGNYSLVQPTGLTASISQKAVTITGMQAADKIYDGTVTATLSGGTLEGVFYVDQAQVSLSQTGVFASATVGTAIGITSTSSLGGALSGNYSLTQPTGITASITTKDLTVSGTSVVTKTYDATTAASLSGGSLVGLVAGDTTTALATPAGSFLDANVGAAKPVTSAYTLSGALASNYRLIQPSGLTGRVDKATLTVTPTAGLNKVYGDFDPSFTYSLAGYVGGETAAAGLSGLVTRAAGENVATYAYSVGQLSASNYQFALAAGAPTFAITPATLIVKANTDAKFVTQADTVNFNAVSYNGFVNGETSSVLSGTLAVTRTNAAQNNAGTYAGVLQPSGLTSNNYTIQYQTGDYVIVPAGQLLIRAANTTTTYGTNPTLNTVSVKYMQDNNGTTELMTLVPSPGNPALYTDGVGGSVTFNLAAPGPLSSSGALNVGQYGITATNVVKQGNNFLSAPVVIGNLSVTQKSLTPQAAPIKTYDGTTALPLANLTLSGLLAGDQVTSTSNGLYQSRHAGNTVGYTIYDVAISGSDSANYYLTSAAFSANNGVITPKAVTLAPQAVSKTYDGSATVAATNADLAVLTSQLGIAGDMVTGVTLTYDNKNAGANKSLAASNVTIADGNNGLNYAISYLSNTASTIARATVTVAGSTVTTKAYDGTVAAAITGGTLVGVVGSDQVVLAQSGLFANANAASSIAVTATDTLSGLAASNYSLIQPTGLTGTITPKTVSVSGTVVADKIYSGTTDATIATLGSIQGLVGSETLALNGIATFDNANAGINKSVALNYTLSNGSGLASNYNLPLAATSATITPASLVVKANNDARFIAQGDAFNYNGVNYAGFVNGETSAVLGGALVVSRSNLAQNAAATYNGVLLPSGLTSNNYSISYQTGNYTIIPADQVLVRMDNVAQTYGTSLSLAPQSVQYLSSGNVLTTLTQSAANHNTYTYNDGLGGSVNFTLTPANPVASTSGSLVVGNYVVAGSGISVGGSNFIGTPVFIGEISILKSALTASTSQVSKTYDGSASMGAVSVQFAGIVSQSGASDVVSSTGTGLYETKNAGTNISYSVSGLALNGADAGNYYIAGGTIFTGSNGMITPKAVQLVAGTSQKTYDGTTSVAATAADLAALTAQLGVAGDKVDAVTLQYANRNAGTGKVLTPSVSVISDGQGGGNYQITYGSSNTSLILSKAVTLTPQSASKTYDASTNYNANASDLSYLSTQLGVVGDTVAGITLVTADKTIGTKTLAASTALINDGNNGLNYTVSYGSSSIAVAAKTISTLNTTVVSKTYDKNTAATLTGGVLNGVEIGDSVTLTQAGIFATNQAGSNIAVTAIESISGADAGNYLLSPTLGLTGTINQRVLTVTYGGINKVYDTSTLAQVTTSDNRLAGDNIIINRTAAFTSANVGSNINVQLSGVYLSGGDADNYSVSATGNTAATITQRQVLVTRSTVDTKVYDGTTNATLSNGVVVGFLGTDTATLNQVGSFASKNAGSNIVVTGQDTLSGASAGNYIIEQPIGLTGIITPKTLSVAGSTVADRIYDGTTAIASTAGTLFGFVGTETVTATSVATASSKNVGTQTATLVYTLANGRNGGLAGNYSLANTTLPVSITVKDLSVIGTRIETKIFDGKTDAKASGGILVGVVGGDQISLIESAFFASSNVGLSVPVIMNNQIIGAFVGNYRLLQPQGVTGTINANTPIIYPSVAINTGVAAAPASVTTPSVAPVTGGSSGGWVVETTAASVQAGQTDASAASAPVSTATGVTIKVSADTGALQNAPDFLNVGRVVTLDGGANNPSITSASINFVKGFEPGRTILELNQLGPVQVRIDNASGRILLTGTASVSEYNRIIQSIRLKLNGASQQRAVAMNIGLVDITGKRDTRMITLKPNDVGNSAEIKVPAPSQSITEQATKPVREQQGRITLPALPAAPIQVPSAAPRRQTTALELNPQRGPIGFEFSSDLSSVRNQFVAASSHP